MTLPVRPPLTKVAAAGDIVSRDVQELLKLKPEAETSGKPVLFTISREMLFAIFLTLTKILQNNAGKSDQSYCDGTSA